MGILGVGQVQELQEYISTRNTGHCIWYRITGQNSWNMILTSQVLI